MLSAVGFNSTTWYASINKKRKFGLNGSHRRRCRWSAPLKMSKNLLKLLIIVKAKRRNGVCYIGLDIEKGKFIRPALRKSTSTWLPKDPELQIGEEHLFEKSRDPLQISHPHQQDNVLVSYLKVAGSFQVGMLFDNLVDLSHQTVKEVFGNMEDFN